jgi:hypothetical protein
MTTLASIRVTTIFLLMVAITAPASGAQPASVFTYQGRLSDNGIPAVGNFDFEIRLYDAESGGNLLLTSQQNSIVVADGVFSAPIDYSAVPNAFTNRQVWAEVDVGESGQALSSLGPRTPINAAPQANYSVTAGRVLATRPEVLGSSAAIMQGNGGIGNMLQACQTTHADSRVCTSQDVQETTVGAGNNTGWILPSDIKYTSAGTGSTNIGVMVYDSVSGLYTGDLVSIAAGPTAIEVVPVTVNCISWTNSGSQFKGIYFNGANEQITLNTCNTEHPVLCCRDALQ